MFKPQVSLKEAGTRILKMCLKCTQFFRTYENIKGSKILRLMNSRKTWIDQKVKRTHKKPTCETIHT